MEFVDYEKSLEEERKFYEKVYEVVGVSKEKRSEFVNWAIENHMSLLRQHREKLERELKR